MGFDSRFTGAADDDELGESLGRRHGLAAARLYRIFVRDLMLPCRIGVYPHERMQAQRVRFNVELTVEEPAGPIGDDIANVVSYDEIVETIRDITAAGHINLSETLAARIAESCLADPRVHLAKVRIEKLDVEPQAGSVGVEIERGR